MRNHYFMQFSSLWRVTFGEMDNFWHLFDFQGAQKRVKNWNLSLTSDCIKSLMRNYVSMQICSFWGSLLIQFLINSSNFHSFWPQGCPRKVSKKSDLSWNIEFVVRNLIPVQICSFGGHFQDRQFWPFLPPTIIRVPPKWSKKNVVWQK